jgi:hypothetical protein
LEYKWAHQKRISNFYLVFYNYLKNLKKKFFFLYFTEQFGPIAYLPISIFDEGWWIAMKNEKYHSKMNEKREWTSNYGWNRMKYDQIQHQAASSTVNSNTFGEKGLKGFKWPFSRLQDRISNIQYITVI